MIRLHVVVEGQSEETFVKRILREPLAAHGVYVDARCTETSRSRARICRGGLLDYGRARRDLVRWMKEDQNADAHFTTMFDLYRLPADFPDFREAKRKRKPIARVEHLEEAFRRNLEHPRFLPYIQLHEFEALLLIAPNEFVTVFPDRSHSVQRLVEMVKQFESPELIDDGEQTAPSKRIIKEIPEYARQKVTASAIVAEKIGLDAMRATCPHFAKWLHKLEELVGAGGTDG